METLPLRNREMVKSRGKGNHNQQHEDLDTANNGKTKKNMVVEFRGTDASFRECMEMAKALAKGLRERFDDVVCAMVFGSLARGRVEFKDIDLFILTNDVHEIENPLISGPFVSEVHLMSLRELDEMMDEKILYGIWRDGFLVYGDPDPLYRKVKAFLEKRGMEVKSLRIERAWLGLKDAKRKLEEYGGAKTDVERGYHLSTACEHAFHSAILATEELLIRNKYSIPSDHGERFRMLEDLSKKRSEIARLKLKERMGSLFSDLHVRGYYRGTLTLDEAEKCIEKVENYVKEVEKLLEA